MKYLSTLLIICLSFGYACSPQKSIPKTQGLLQLQNMMTGSFDSHRQATEDSSYYNISLEMFPIWKGKGYWLYVEQAVTSAKDKPYRQRIYQLEQISNNTFVSKVFTLKEPKRFIGKYADLSFFDQFDTSLLEEREGCGVFLTFKNGMYQGSTKDKDCKSTLRGASYATSKVDIYKDRIESWDQGFDVDDKQVWGAVKAGYIFDKK